LTVKKPIFGKRALGVVVDQLETIDVETGYVYESFVEAKVDANKRYTINQGVVRSLLIYCSGSSSTLFFGPSYI
jgi:hypothetical protein